MQRSRLIGAVLLALAGAACGDSRRGAASSGDSSAMTTAAPVPAAPNSASVTGMRTDTAAAIAAKTAIPPAPATIPQAAIVVSAVGGSGVTGEMTTVAKGGSTTVTIKLIGATAGARLRAFVHGGTCAAAGAIAAPLEPVTIVQGGTGTSSTTVALPMRTLLDGSHAVQVHAAAGSGGAPGKVVACADLPKMPG